MVPEQDVIKLAAPFSLYLDITKGKHAELAAVSLAALSLSSAFQELSFVLDPSITIKIELVSGTTGSLFLNSNIKAEDGDKKRRLSLKAICIVAGLWFVDHVADKLFDYVWSKLIEGEEVTASEEQDIKRLVEGIVNAVRRSVAKPHVQGVYRALISDENIIGVGVTTVPGKKPESIVPREYFLRRSGNDRYETIYNQRKTTSRQILSIIKPVLKIAHRRWKFSGRDGEFGAYIKDTAFVSNLLNGRIHIPLVSGILIDADVQLEEEYVDGIWIPRDRFITKVYRVIPPDRQGELNLNAFRKSKPTKKNSR